MQLSSSWLSFQFPFPPLSGQATKKRPFLVSGHGWLKKFWHIVIGCVLCTSLYINYLCHRTVVQGGQKYEKWLCFLALFISYLETSFQMWLRTTFFLLIYQFIAIWQLLFAKKGLFFCSKNAHFLIKNGSSLFFSPENGFHVTRLKNWYDIVEIYSKQ